MSQVKVSANVVSHCYIRVSLEGPSLNLFPSTLLKQREKQIKEKGEILVLQYQWR